MKVTTNLYIVGKNEYGPLFFSSIVVGDNDDIVLPGWKLQESFVAELDDDVCNADAEECEVGRQYEADAKADARTDR